MTDATKVAPGRVGQEDVSPKIDSLRGPHKTPTSARQCGQVHRAFDRNEDINVFWDRLGPTYVNDVSINSALATLGAIASGTMALTAIIFSIAYITVQFSAIAYSPRLAFSSAPRSDPMSPAASLSFLLRADTVAPIEHHRSAHRTRCPNHKSCP